MKKVSLFLATLLIVALGVCSSCSSKNDPDSNTDTNYIGMWRIDSVFESGQMVRPPHVLIEVKSASEVVFDGMGKYGYRFEGSKLIIDEHETTDIEVISAAKPVPHLRMTDLNDGTARELYLSQIKPISGEAVSLTEANLIGVWKFDYHEQRDYHGGVLDPTSVGKNTHPGVDMWDFRAGGEAYYSNTVDLAEGNAPQKGWWSISNGRIAFRIGDRPATIGADYYEDVARFTSTGMQTHTSVSWSGSDMTCTEDYYYTRVK